MHASKATKLTQLAQMRTACWMLCVVMGHQESLTGSHVRSRQVRVLAYTFLVGHRTGNARAAHESHQQHQQQGW